MVSCCRITVLNAPQQSLHPLPLRPPLFPLIFSPRSQTSLLLFGAADHCETPAVAYEDIAPILTQIALHLQKAPQDLTIYE